MPATREIRAEFDRDVITVYQAYPPEIANAALTAGRFVAPFSFGRMTWIKPSFLWMMHRSNWAQKRGQERVLRVQITRAGWEKALSLAVQTSFDGRLFRSREAWRAEFELALVQLQWDPERSLRGGSLNHRSIQIGLSRHIILEYVESWLVRIDDLTPLVRKIYQLMHSGRADRAAEMLPAERIYPLPAELCRRLSIGDRSLPAPRPAR